VAVSRASILTAVYFWKSAMALSVAAFSAADLSPILFVSPICHSITLADEAAGDDEAEGATGAGLGASTAATGFGASGTAPSAIAALEEQKRIPAVMVVTMIPFRVFSTIRFAHSFK